MCVAVAQKASLQTIERRIGAAYRPLHIDVGMGMMQPTARECVTKIHAKAPAALHEHAAMTHIQNTLHETQRDSRVSNVQHGRVDRVQVSVYATHS